MSLKMQHFLADVYMFAVAAIFTTSVAKSLCCHYGTSMAGRLYRGHVYLQQCEWCLDDEMESASVTLNS